MMTIPTSKRAISAFQKRLGIPRGATHFCLSIEGHNPIIDAVKNLDVAAGCTGTLEFGKLSGRGRNRSFAAMEWQVPDQTPTANADEAIQTPAQEAIDPQDDTEPAPATETPQRGRRKGTRHTIAGQSACAVLKALGKAGVKYAEADAILRHHGIEMPKASVSVQLGFGRNEATWARHGKPADLDEAAIAQLRSTVEVATPDTTQAA